MSRSLGRFRKVYTCMWGDDKFRQLSAPQPCGQVLWFHLIAGRQCGPIPGAYSIGEAGFAEQLGWPLKAFREAFAEALSRGMVKADWESRFVWVPNAIKFNAPVSPNVVTSWSDYWAELPWCALKDEAWQVLKDFLEDFGEAFAKAFDKSCPKPSRKTSRKTSGNQESESESEQEKQTSSADADGAFDFEDWWKVYPRRVGKHAARKAWDQAVRGMVLGGYQASPTPKTRAEAQAYLLDRAMVFASSPKGQSGQWCPLPTTWLNQGRWDDDPKEWQRQESAVADAKKDPSVPNYSN